MRRIARILRFRDDEKSRTPVDEGIWDHVLNSIRSLNFISRQAAGDQKRSPVLLTSQRGGLKSVEPLHITGRGYRDWLVQYNSPNSPPSCRSLYQFLCLMLDVKVDRIIQGNDFECSLNLTKDLGE